jgi:16S rRNA C967 or C1407 C5-methylase (RsmB/RsmF family)/NOL1/NOP2/fmu family ribosome biogenesis protein
MYPSEFTDRLKLQEYIDSRQLLNALNDKPQVSIRINPSKWLRIPDNSSAVQWSENGYYLESRPSFTSDPLFHSGCYYPQEASSMFIEQVFNQLIKDQSDLKVLDLCAAPGGKSTHLSTLVGENGFIVANEVIRSRAGILSENVTKWGLGNVIVTNNDPEAFSRLNDYFDLILIDAPCSGEGMFSEKDVRLEWSAENAAMCSERQKRILKDAWSSLKGNGLLIYSTCTFNPAENEENIKWLTDLNGSATQNLDISKFTGISEISYQGITGYGFYPGRIKGEGLFISVVRKAGIHDAKRLKSSKNKDNQLTISDIKIARNLLDVSSVYFIRNDDIIYQLSLPVEQYLYLKNFLRIIKGGTALFKSRKNDFTPLHELALSTKIKSGAFPEVELEYQQAIAFLKKENLALRNAVTGWIILTYMDINLGFAKNIGSRLNNYFPVDWRIRMQDSEIATKSLIDWL